MQTGRPIKPLLIEATLRKIRRSLPALADELALRVKTGTFCVYTPDPVHPTDWTV